MGVVFSVTDTARMVGCRPRDVSDAFYAGVLDDSKVLHIGGRRVIPEAYVATIREVLTRLGKTHPEMASA